MQTLTQNNLSATTQATGCASNHSKKPLPINGKFYQGILDGTRQFVDENKAYVLIYFAPSKKWEFDGKVNLWELATHVIDMGLPPPILIEWSDNPDHYYWPVKNLKVQVYQWGDLQEKAVHNLAIVLSKYDPIEIQLEPFGGPSPLKNSKRKVVRYVR